MVDAKWYVSGSPLYSLIWQCSHSSSLESRWRVREWEICILVWFSWFKWSERIKWVNVICTSRVLPSFARGVCELNTELRDRMNHRSILAHIFILTSYCHTFLSKNRLFEDFSYNHAHVNRSKPGHHRKQKSPIRLWGYRRIRGWDSTDGEWGQERTQWKCQPEVSLYHPPLRPSRTRGISHIRI